MATFALGVVPDRETMAAVSARHWTRSTRILDRHKLGRYASFVEKPADAHEFYDPADVGSPRLGSRPTMTRVRSSRATIMSRPAAELKSRRCAAAGFPAGTRRRTRRNPTANCDATFGGSVWPVAGSAACRRSAVRQRVNVPLIVYEHAREGPGAGADLAARRAQRATVSGIAVRAGRHREHAGRWGSSPAMIDGRGLKEVEDNPLGPSRPLGRAFVSQVFDQVPEQLLVARTGAGPAT